MYAIEFSNSAKADLAKLKKNTPMYFAKAKKLLKEIAEHPRTGTGKPERLKGYEGEVYSREISKKDRLVYEIFENKLNVWVVSAEGHYGDK